MSRRPFDIEDIFIGERHRHPDMKKVEEIARSISDIGLLNAPAVCMRDDVTMPDGEVCDSAPVLIFGRHRLLALQSLGHTVVECEVYDVDDLRAELMEIDENLARSELSPAEEAAHIARRKAIWDEMNGDNTERNPSSIQRGRGQPKQFASELANITGDSKTQINVKIARVRGLGPDIQRIVGTSLDKGVEMDALMSLPAEKREELISQAEQGEKVSARTTSDPTERKSRQRQMFWDMWAKLDDDVRQELSAVIVAQHKH
ncbi:ParB/RepB/Spo0J family partition protein [Ochrobactrum sp. MYb379]|uniref:ParB/RepB/Spo0J family partition protein n=1 Tax=Ochrobactrum sp. MYb379 TaxID=2745275 RepID=UPI0030B50AA6